MQQYKLSAPGISATFLSFGAALQSLQVKDRQGKWTDVVAGYDDPEEYTRKKTFNGAIIGWVGQARVSALISGDIPTASARASLPSTAKSTTFR